MNTYPALRQGVDSTETRLGGRVLDRATNGKARVRSFFTTEKKLFKVVHQFMTSTQKAQIESFYTVNQNLEFLFLWIPDNTVYTCVFDATDPVYTQAHGGYWNIDVFLA